MLRFLNILLLIYSYLPARDLYVSKAAQSEYQKDDYLLFDAFNDTLEYAHSAHPDYQPAKDAVILGDDGPVLGSSFTQEVRIYIEKKRNDTQWASLMGYVPYEDLDPTDDGNPNRVAGSVPRRVPYKQAPFIYRASPYGIQYGFGDGESECSEIVDDLITEKGRWYHIATTFDGTNFRLYIDGEEVNNFLGCEGKTPHPTPVKYIGGFREGPGKFFGRMDELRMWNYSRSEQQIQGRMNSELSGYEFGLVAYYPMDINNQFLLDKSGNGYHGEMIGPTLRYRYYSDDCPVPDGTMFCPFPTIEDALEEVQPWDNIILRGGRYTEFIMRDGVNYDENLVWGQLEDDYAGPPTNTVTIEPYPNEEVIIDGTISIDVNWEPYNHNGNIIFRAILDSAKIAESIQRPFRDVYGLWIGGRYQIPSVTPNIKNPTDPSYGGPNDQVPGTFWEVDIVQADVQNWDVNRGNGLARLDFLDTLEEWAFDPDQEMLYIYPDERFLPTSTNVRIRVLHKMMSIRYMANVEFRNLKFFGGAVEIEGLNVLFEDCEFEYLHDITLPAFRDFGSLCCGLRTRNIDFTNCKFSHIPYVYSLKIRGIHSKVENCLFDNMDWWANPGGGGPELGYVCRYVTFKNSKIGGVGGSSLMEYCLIEDYIDPCDCSGINRGAFGAPRSMTRYNWIINGPGANGIRFDGGKTGAGNRRGDIHHIMTIGNNRGMRLKGDFHEVYHVTSYDNRTLDIDLFVGKYAEPGELNHGEYLDYTPGNANTKIKNCIVESSFGCPLDDCWPYPESEHGSGNPEYPSYLFDQGIWYGLGLKNASVHKELMDPWHLSLYLDDSSSTYRNGYPHPTDRSQDYDFRPRKGSSLIDAGVVIEGINDGQDLQFNWPPSYPGQNRRFVGDAPDIGAYEYGDSVYWIPGYRYPYPSFPIPRNRAVDVIPDYSVVWNYPYKKDYSNTTATVTINGPGVNRIETFNYPHNVCFQAFQPGGNYTWSVNVDGESGGTWSFTVDNDIYPLNDRSVDTTANDIVLPTNQRTLEVKDGHVAFILFEVPSSVDNSWDVNLNLFVKDVENLTGGIIVYDFNQIIWSEKKDNKNIGIIDHALGLALDTLYSLEHESSVSLDMNHWIDGSGIYSFALGVMNQDDHVTFCSNEAMYTSGYTPYPSYWPSLSFTPSIDSVEVVLSIPPDDSTIFLNSTSDDSILFEWDFTHNIDTANVIYYELQIGLPVPSISRDMDTLSISVNSNKNNAKISKKDLLDLLVESNLYEGEFIWDVNGVLNTGEMIAVKSHSFHTMIDDPDYKSNFPNSYRLYNNYPNPFNPNTTISYDLKNWSRVTIEVFDIVGRKIVNLEKNISKPPGTHYTEWNGKNLGGAKMASGVYFLKIKVKEYFSRDQVFIDTQKMMLLK